MSEDMVCSLHASRKLCDLTLNKLFSREPECDETVLEILDQLTPAEGLAHPPTDKEIYDAIKTLRNTGESGICTQLYKCLSGSGESFRRLK